MAFNECISHECRALISAANGGGFQNEISVLFLSLFIGFLSCALPFPPSLSSSPLRVHIPFHHAFPTRTLLLTPATRRHVYAAPSIRPKAHKLTQGAALPEINC